MKINTQETTGIALPRKPHQQPVANGTGFDELLEKAMMPQSAQPATSSALSSLQSISPLNFAIPTGMPNSEQVQHVDKLLNIMESYQAAMADPRASLKDAYPLVQMMEKKTAELLPVLESLPAGDKLKDILNQALITSTVETIKFNRGDYV
jgi:hypothetical protein